MRRAAALTLAVFALGVASGCAHLAPPTPLASPPLPPLEEPAARLLLIGDAGVEPDDASVLDEAAAFVHDHAAPTVIVFLGDNFYPTDTKGNFARVLLAQRAVARAPEDVTFVPGNHDWHPRGARLFGHFDRERIDVVAGAVRAQWRPAPGELGPELVAPTHGLFRVLAIDSERWRLAAGACAKNSNACTELHAAEQRLAAALDCAGCAPAVVVAHHPLRTVGEHGGCELSWLRRMVKLGGQDVAAPAYQAYIASLERALAAHPALLFAAGHDHSLQVAHDPAIGTQIVSGAGAHRTQVCGAPDASWSRSGFMALDFAQGSAPRLRVFALDDAGALREVHRESLAR
jgi:hypothetical protein